MTDQKYQQSIDIIADHYMSRVEYFVEQGDAESCHALYSEYVVDGQDPEDGVYQWTFIPSLSNT